MTDGRDWGAGYLDDDDGFRADDPRTWCEGGALCQHCGVELTPENLAGRVTEKPQLGQDGHFYGGHVEFVCKRCMGIPDDLSIPPSHGDKS